MIFLITETQTIVLTSNLPNPNTIVLVECQQYNTKEHMLVIVGIQYRIHISVKFYYLI